MSCFGLTARGKNSRFIFDRNNFSNNCAESVWGARRALDPEKTSLNDKILIDMHWAVAQRLAYKSGGLVVGGSNPPSPIFRTCLGYN